MTTIPASTASSITSTHRAAVLGSPIDHSLSPVLHNAGYRSLGLTHWSYDRILCTDKQLPDLIDNADSTYQGFSVTMPAKFAALEYASEATPRALRIGSANTLVRRDAGWLADNTDVDGVVGALGELFAEDFTPLQGEQALVIGAGGTARPAVWALILSGIRHITIANRSDRSSEFYPLLEDTDASLNFVRLDEDISEFATKAAVTVSTIPAQGSSNLAQQVIHAPLLDVIYSPWPTPLTQAASAHGTPIVGGHVMLAHQAFTQFKLFTGEDAPRDVMRSALYQALNIAPEK
ncbi:shikimate dehydrogenase [Corynebacterium pseudotuberculosis]|uniref:shikimate dehydrogenase (NADP(+)) n=1 Tax=Corynebacterium pseudotuberculosis 258 TaxID=1168865 RepID=A0AAU8PQQ1_CORPS|nr:shikimate dehydrogenase [Corynebacterium pseudotuberculosis]AEQ06699.3 shikimate dehydrogenase [Corynebacterium pseudotuberculosis CIP 52.97]AFB72497.2 shikimate dehydrogenase [Corynebacterium pseudotuberculosis 316]AFK16792.1 shikimate dehydrogenase [Corynebacterium pseudotuberculosis 258]AKS13486.1 Shikimate dehydrogenase [Corynebacterium pseudotuberculosis]AMN70097.1 shikimate dehydrogenase [Corynebacterium pseudotuberculosis]